MDMSDVVRLTLSEAIRAGCKLTGASKANNYFGSDDSTCVMGAALVGFAGSVSKARQLRNEHLDLVELWSMRYETSDRTREEVADEVEASGS